jgi:hypothetical protein
LQKAPDASPAQERSSGAWDSSVLRGNTPAASVQQAVNIAEWVGSYSTLGVFYYQTGQIEKAREVLDRFKGNNAGGLTSNVSKKFYQLLRYLSCQPANLYGPRQQLLQMALMIADRSL